MYTKPDSVGITFRGPPLLTACKGLEPQVVVVLPQRSQKSCSDGQLRL